MVDEHACGMQLQIQDWCVLGLSVLAHFCYKKDKMKSLGLYSLCSYGASTPQCSGHTLQPVGFKSRLTISYHWLIQQIYIRTKTDVKSDLTSSEGAFRI